MDKFQGKVCLEEALLFLTFAFAAVCFDNKESLLSGPRSDWMKTFLEFWKLSTYRGIGNWNDSFWESWLLLGNYISQHKKTGSIDITMQCIVQGSTLCAFLILFRQLTIKVLKIEHVVNQHMLHIDKKWHIV